MYMYWQNDNSYILWYCVFSWKQWSSTSQCKASSLQYESTLWLQHQSTLKYMTPAPVNSRSLWLQHQSTLESMTPAPVNSMTPAPVNSMTPAPVNSRVYDWSVDMLTWYKYVSSIFMYIYHKFSTKIIQWKISAN